MSNASLFRPTAPSLARLIFLLFIALLIFCLIIADHVLGQHQSGDMKHSNIFQFYMKKLLNFDICYLYLDFFTEGGDSAIDEDLSLIGEVINLFI